MSEDYFLSVDPEDAALAPAIDAEDAEFIYDRPQRTWAPYAALAAAVVSGVAATGLFCTIVAFGMMGAGVLVPLILSLLFLMCCTAHAATTLAFFTHFSRGTVYSPLTPP